jgi:hypothetical protein
MVLTRLTEQSKNHLTDDFPGTFWATWDCLQNPEGSLTIQAIFSNLIISNISNVQRGSHGQKRSVEINFKGKKG